MADLSHKRIEDIDAITGMLDGVSMYRAASDLGLRAFGMSIVELEPGADAYPEHDHSAEGMGGRMFAKRPEQLGQEEVYFALRGSGTVVADGTEYPLDPDHVIRVGPEVVRKVLPGDDGLRLLIVGATPGEAYATGGTL
jgi:mannose-6-phosphate isomerase-like protein (cupin superfamily)